MQIFATYDEKGYVLVAGGYAVEQQKYIVDGLLINTIHQGEVLLNLVSLLKFTHGKSGRRKNNQFDKDLLGSWTKFWGVEPSFDKMG